MSRTAIRMLVGALLAVTVLAGCSVRPGAAAVVDGTVISQDELARAQEELAPLLSDPSASSVLTVLIIVPVLVKAAEDHGVGVSVDAARKLLTSVAESAKITDVPDYGDGAVAFARAQLANEALSKLDGAADIFNGLKEQFAASDVRVNPQYGTWDTPSQSVKALTFPWIAGSTTK